MDPVDVKSTTYINFCKEINDEDPKYQNIKTFLQKAILKIGLKKFLWLQRLEKLFRRHILLVILKVKKLFEGFTKKNCKKQMKTCLEMKN